MKILVNIHQTLLPAFRQGVQCSLVRLLETRDGSFDVVIQGGGAPETMWRCATCGKWSHAKRRPRGHERRIPADGWIEPEGLIRTDTEMEFDTGAEVPVSWWVKCGPFERWDAILVREAAAPKQQEGAGDVA